MTGTVRLITDGQRDQLAKKMSLAIPASFTFADAQGIIEASKGAFEEDVIKFFDRRRTTANVLRPPFAGARLVGGEPVPYAGPVALGHFQLLSVLKADETVIRVAEMVRRGREDMRLSGTAAFGNRDLNDLWEMRKQIPVEDFPVGSWAFAIGDVWEDGNGDQCVECVYRGSAGDWRRRCDWFDSGVDADDRLLRRK